MSDAAESARIRSLRPAKPPVDPWRPLDILAEEERGRDGRLRSSVTVFLAGSECPFACVFCDLWQYTLDEPTPRGAIPQQLEVALASLQGAATPHSIKLYNASNFFDGRAVPPEDLDTIAHQLAGFRRVTVECHPRLVGESCFRFAEHLEGQLEVAMGLETIHPQALPRLNKQMTLADFDRAVGLLLENHIGARAFVLLSPPFVPARESVEWSVRSVCYAWERGVEVVSLIPLRVAAGEMQRLTGTGEHEPPTLEMFDEAMASSLALGGGVVLADLWDLEKMLGCANCRQARIEHLREMNRTGAPGVPVECDRCPSPTAGHE